MQQKTGYPVSRQAAGPLQIKKRDNMRNFIPCRSLALREGMGQAVGVGNPIACHL